MEATWVLRHGAWRPAWRPSPLRGLSSLPPPGQAGLLPLQSLPSLPLPPLTAQRGRLWRQTDPRFSLCFGTHFAACPGSWTLQVLICVISHLSPHLSTGGHNGVSHLGGRSVQTVEHPRSPSFWTCYHLSLFPPRALVSNQPLFIYFYASVLHILTAETSLSAR